MNNLLKLLVNQDFPKDQYEIIVAYNGFDDKTLDVAKTFTNYFPRLVKYVIENKIQSSYAARNKGIRIAKGQVLAFIDSDCIPTLNWLSQGYSTLVKNKVSMLAGRIKFTYKNSKPNLWEYFDASTKLNQKSYVENAGFGATANLFVRKKMFDKYGLFLPEFQSGGDYEFGRRLTQLGEVLLYAETSLVYHPARFTFRDKLAKSKRVAKGQKMLERMGLLNHGQLNWRQLILTKHYPSLPGINIRIDEKFMLVLINNFFRYYNFFKRL